MAIWKILLITLLSAVTLGCVAGVLIGKHMIKRSRSDYKPLLSLKERIIYLSCMTVGAACILLGIFNPFQDGGAQDPSFSEGPFEEGVMVYSGEEDYGGGEVFLEGEGEEEGESEEGGGNGEADSEDPGEEGEESDPGESEDDLTDQESSLEE